MNQAIASISRFEAVHPRILQHEGGFVDHPRDPGGATNQGITQRTYNAYRNRQGLPVRSVRHLEAAERDTIYLGQYWNAVGAGSLPRGLDYAIYDFAVNSGPSAAARHLQRAVGVNADGVIGVITLDAVSRFEPATLIEQVCASRMRFLRGLITWGDFGRGWTNRVNDVRRVALADAARVALPTSPRPVASTPKALESDLRLPRSPEATGGIVAAILTPIATISTGLFGLAEASPIIQYTVAGGIVAAFVVAGVFGARFLLRRKSDNPLGAL